MCQLSRGEGRIKPRPASLTVALVAPSAGEGPGFVAAASRTGVFGENAAGIHI
jgi:hypothetical protein